MQKFKILILDDEGENGASGGHSRIIGFLRRTKFLSPEQSLELDYFELVGSDYFEIHVWGGGTFMSFDDVLEQIHEKKEKLGLFDIIFIDIKWDDPLNKDSSILLDDKWKNHALKLGSLTEGKQLRAQVPKEIAGMRLFYEISKYAQYSLKVIFSGAQETVDIRYLMMAFLEGRYDDEDFIIGNLEDGTGYWPNVAEKIEERLRKRREEVISIQTEEMLAKLEARVEKIKQDSKDYSKADIIDYRDANNFWSLQTLFPRQINSILLTANDSRIYKEAEQQLENGLYSYPRSLSHFCMAKFPGHANADNKEFLKTLLYDRLPNKEYKKEFVENGKNALSFKPITYFLPRQNAPYSEGKARTLKEELIQPEEDWSFRQEWPRLVSNEDLVTCMTYAGFYPGYLDYIYQIALHNADKRKQDITEAYLKMEERKFKIIFRMRLRKIGTKIPSEWLTGVRTKMDKINQKRILLTLSDEGLGDLVNIVCQRYQGRFNLIRSQDRVECQRQTNARIATTLRSREDDHKAGAKYEQAEKNEIIYRIDIPLIFLPK